MKHIRKPLVSCWHCSSEFLAEPDDADERDRFTCARCAAELRFLSAIRRKQERAA